MISSKITRVHCNTCRSQHAYRPHPPGEQPASAPGRSPSRRTDGESRATRGTGAPAHNYATLLQGRGAANARPYSPQARFAPKDLIAHPTFGLGVVVLLKDNTKIDVLFPDGMKTLLHSH
jgi:hypothetical protein